MAEHDTTEAPEESLAHIGTAVEVHSEFSGRWVPGFDVAEAGNDGVRLRRKSDRLVLPDWFPTDAVRPVPR